MKLIRSSLWSVAIAAVVAVGLTPVQGQDKGQVVVCSWGGSFMDAQREAMFKPFEKATGIKVVEATTPEFAKIRTMVQSGNTEWDVVLVVPSDYIALVDLGMLEKLDYDSFDKAVLGDIARDVVKPHGLGSIFYSEAVAYSTKAFPGTKGPRTWADVWDVKKFPGKRMLYSGEWVIRPVEGALMADGVPASKLYPLDLERAYKALDRIRPHVVKWATTPAMPPQALVDGEAVIVQAPINRIQALKEKGVPVDFVWEGALTQFDLWAIPKGAKNAKNAMAFIEFASRPEQLAALAKVQPLGPVNKKAFGLIPPERAKILPGHPDTLSKVVMINAEWWAQKDASGKTNIEKNSEMWNKWILKK